ncbi:MAG: response regulator transcription factor [Candidatus Eremiobacteraeota bacterium]|nr:response regulator transcription factor [Candidatus Eremiobacteraeota bacterium]
MLAGVTNRTLIIEGQALFAKALAQVLTLDPSIQVVGDADSLTEASVRAARPDLILIDIDGNNLDLVETVQTARTAAPNVKICALSMHVQPDVMQRCLNAGVDGFVVKDVTPNEFMRAIKSVAGGETYVDPRIAGRLLRRRSSNSRYPDPADLSMREIEVVRLIVAGMSNKEISASLHLSEKTIKNHVSRIFTKFNCTARTQAAVYALRSGLV